MIGHQPTARRLAGAKPTKAPRPIACQFMAPRGAWIVLCDSFRPATERPHPYHLFPRNPWTLRSAAVMQGRAE